MNQDNIYRGVPPIQRPAVRDGSAPSGTRFFDPAHVARVVMLRWYTVVLMTILGVVAGFFYVQTAPRKYLAEAELEMNIRRPRVINSDAVFEDYGDSRDEDVIFNTRFAKFRSPAMEELAVQEYFHRFPEDENPSKGIGVGKYELASLIKKVAWWKDPKANIVKVSYTSSNPEFAARLVNVLSECAGMLMMQENQALSDEAVKWLVSQAESQQSSLEEVERQLSKLRADLQLDALQQRKAVLDQALVSDSAERQALISTLASRQTVFDFVKKLQGTDPNLEVLPPGLPKEEQLAELIQTWRNAHEELSLMADRYTELHPDYRQAAEKEARARSRLDQFIDLSAKSVQNEIDLLGQQVGQVDRRIAKMKDELLGLEQELATGMLRVQTLERQRDAADNAYQSTLRRMEEARLSADENMAFTKVIRAAREPRVPVSPKKTRSMVVATFLGCFSGCLLVVSIAFFTDKIVSVNDLRSLGLGILGVVPSQKKVDSRSELATIGLRDKFCPVVEIFAGINALITSDKYVDSTKVLLVGSAMPGEGKTVAACNLAISSALNGRRTLLIDGDLRRPQLVNVFAMEPEQGSLLEWLVKDERTTTFSHLVSGNVIENLDIIASRPLKDINPAELLGRGRIAELVEWAKGSYDRIIIDSPPLGAVGDAQVLANHADAVIVVSRVGMTRRRALQFTLARFHEIDARILGCIANDVPNTLVGMFGGAEGYGYGSHYGHYKSYSES